MQWSVFLKHFFKDCDEISFQARLTRFAASNKCGGLSYTIPATPRFILVTNKDSLSLRCCRVSWYVIISLINKNLYRFFIAAMIPISIGCFHDVTFRWKTTTWIPFLSNAMECPGASSRINRTLCLVCSCIWGSNTSLKHLLNVGTTIQAFIYWNLPRISWNACRFLRLTYHCNQQSFCPGSIAANDQDHSIFCLLFAPNSQYIFGWQEPYNELEAERINQLHPSYKHKKDRTNQ